jgi:hypothetical protein
MLKKITCYILIGYALVGCSSKNFPVGNFQAAKIKIDGNANDWGLPLRFGSEVGSLQYNITNDRDNIYLCVLTNDKNTQNKILRSGLSIYFDMNGTKSKKVGFVFPVMNSRQFKADGFLGVENGVYYIDESPLRVAMDNDEYGNLVIEAKVPIEYLTNKTITAKSALNISVGIIVRNSPGGNRPAGNESRESYNEGGGMRGGGMRGGGMRGGGMSGGMGSMGGGMRGGGMSSGGVIRGGPVGQEIVNWYQFKLALN